MRRVSSFEPSRRGPGSYRHIKLETVTRALSMESAARDDSAAPVAADLARDAFGNVIPESLSLSSTDQQ